jgi:hypothetical protein
MMSTRPLEHLMIHTGAKEINGGMLFGVMLGWMLSASLTYLYSITGRR